DEKVARPVRLIGFGVTGLVAQRQAQPELFGEDTVTRERREALSATVDRLRAKLGDASIRRAD
ncbi:MAG: hypothetical protein PHR35_19995, partial [Kiritimatiellae bacterium]|nr:hypothetical protein [Kiritimatiellia bacterium]